MKTLLTLSLATAGTLFLSNCDSIDDEDHRHHGGSTTTTTTEETTTRQPYSGLPSSTTVETQTTRAY